MIEITQQPISPEAVINRVKTASSGCVITYVGLIRQYSRGKPVVSVEYSDPNGEALNHLQEIANQTKQKWLLENITICHRIGRLGVGEINLVIAIASVHRKEGFAACQYAINQFKEKLPTLKRETYQDGSVRVEG
ncbi:MAG: molybdenum cofactor biosynthesis protein MoaE [Dehalococcoidales bacterium]|nr:molybdenum cofactor biosynthesis protein MoaE [Dehalococcoidales bacterium]